MEIKSLDGPSSFVDVMGASPFVRILDFLLGEVGYDFTLKEIAQKSGVGYATVKRIWERFVIHKLVRATRKVSKATFYTYDEKSATGRALRQFYLDVVFAEAEKEGAEASYVAPELVRASVEK